MKEYGEMMLDDGISRLCPDHPKILKSPSRAPIRCASKQRLPQPIPAAPTADPDTAHEWLDRTAAGMEGLRFKRLTEPYRPTARTWRKYKIRATHDGIWRRAHRPTAIVAGAALMGWAIRVCPRSIRCCVP